VALGLMSVLGGCRRNAPAAVPPTGGDARAAGAQPAEVVLPVSEQAGVIAVTKVERSDEPEMLQFPGTIVLPDNETWQVGVLSRGHEPGHRVTIVPGTVLARMHSHDVHEARAAYAMAKADEARSTSAAALAQVNFDRTQKLYGLKAASVEQVEQARQELVNAKTALKNAGTDVLRNKTHLEENLGIPADAPIDSKDENSELIPIRAPASGYILQKNVTPGAAVTEGADVFVLGDLEHLWMLASVGQESLAKLKIGQSAEVTLPGIPDKSFAGTITNLGQAFDPTTRRLQIRIKLEGSSELLHPEMLASAEIAAGTRRPVMLVDSDAVQQVNGQNVVFVREAEDRFAVRAVKVDETVRGKLAIAEGLHPGEEVVTRGGFLLKSQLLKAAMQGD
jgi:cobalt-zinc-cadmium efflux system membrane fusion protein